jgi:hypothetical protein
MGWRRGAQVPADMRYADDGIEIGVNNDLYSHFAGQVCACACTCMYVCVCVCKGLCVDVFVSACLFIFVFLGPYARVPVAYPWAVPPLTCMGLLRVPPFLSLSLMLSHSPLAG